MVPRVRGEAHAAVGFAAATRYEATMAIEIALVGPERLGEFTAPLRTAFGLRYDPDRVARMLRLPELVHRVAALDGGAIVGSAGTYRFTMTTPGGSVPAAGLTMVGVLPTHRRRGALTGMMRRHVDEARAAGLWVTALWASEASIYGRFGYGVASYCSSIAIERDRAVFRRPVSDRGVFRLLDQPAAAAAFPKVWERVRPTIPGMLSRSDVWWDNRRLGDFDKSGSPLQRVLLEVDGAPAGYALYRFAAAVGVPGIVEGDLTVIEAVGASTEATAMLWRYLFDIDLARRIQATCLPPTHPLLHLVTEPRRLRMGLEDAVWLRLIDVEQALGARRWSSHASLTIELDDAFCPWNSGRWRIDGASGAVARSDGPAELALDAAALGSLYLGGVAASQLAEAGEVTQLADGAVEKADLLFRSARAPWCPEIF
jgi:predicted acetyltransferase